MTPEITAELSKATHPMWVSEILQHCLGLLKHSKRKMATKYGVWRKNHEVYKGLRRPDRQDIKASERGEPTKFAVPLTKTQINTFVALLYMLYTQRPYFFECTGTGSEDVMPARLAEALLQRDLNESNWQGTVLYQMLLHVAKYSLGVIKHTWVEEKQLVRKQVQLPSTQFLGMSFGGGVQEVEEWVTKFLGNRVVNVSPFRFYPDTRLPLQRFQEGEFCASEESFSRVQLKQWERDGLIVGVNHIANDKSGLDYEPDDEDVHFESGADMYRTSGQTKSNVRITDMQIRLIPKEFLVDGEALDERDYPVIYTVWIANNNRIVRLEEAGYLHNKFTYDVAQYDPDMDELVSGSLADDIDSLQETITWLLNTRMANVRKLLNNQIIVDQFGINVKDFEDRKSVITLRQNAQGTGVEKYAKQLVIQDVTQGHIGDMEVLKKLAQEVTGLSDNMMGQFATGRRSATEASNVTQGAWARLRMTAQMIWYSAFVPLAQKMLSNLRDGLDVETLVKVAGMDEHLPSKVIGFKATKDHLVGNVDFVVFDGTLPSEKQYTAQAMQEIAMALIQNPLSAQYLGLDFTRLMRDILTLRGFKNFEDYSLPPELVQLGRQLALNKMMEGQLGNVQGNNGQQPIQNGGGQQVSTNDNVLAPAVDAGNVPVVGQGVGGV